MKTVGTLFVCLFLASVVVGGYYLLALEFAPPPQPPPQITAPIAPEIATKIAAKENAMVVCAARLAEIERQWEGVPRGDWSRTDQLRYEELEAEIERLAAERDRLRRSE